MPTFRQLPNWDCDVLIVGGGPGGSALAFHLARQGVKAWVMEAQTFPRDKICGDGVSPIALEELHKMGLTGLAEYNSTNEVKRVALVIEEERIIIDLPKAPDSPFHARIIPRLQLDDWIHQAALGQGAVYLEGARLTHYQVHADHVEVEYKQGGKTRHVRAGMIVGADGSNSTVARGFYGAKPSNEFQLLGLRAYYRGVNGPRDRVDVFFAKDNFPGIYWAFPVGADGANVGLAMVARTFPEQETHVRDLLLNHIQGNAAMRAHIGNGTLEGKIQGWPLKFYNPEHALVGHRLLLIGDAAGLINPLSGDGIQYAVLSARWASEAIIAARQDYSAAALLAYQRRIRKELAFDFALSSLLIQFGRNKALTPIGMEVLNILIARARGDNRYADTIAGIFEGNYPSYKALEIPFLAKSLLQGVQYVGQGVVGGLAAGPRNWIDKGRATKTLAGHLLESLRQDRENHLDWLGDMAGKSLHVAAHLLRSFSQK